MSDTFNFKVEIHQWSVLSPFMFAIVMNVVCWVVVEGLLFEILYADDLVLMETLQLKFHRREVWLKKGLKVNMGKTKGNGEWGR